MGYDDIDIAYKRFKNFAYYNMYNVNYAYTYFLSSNLFRSRHSQVVIFTRVSKILCNIDWPFFILLFKIKILRFVMQFKYVFGE